MTILRKILFFIFILLVVGCELENETELKKDQHSVTTQKGFELVESNNRLGFALINKVKPDENENIFISPMSALIALLMTYNGADGKTKEEFEAALQLNGASATEVNDAVVSLLQMLPKESDTTEVSLANSLWVNEEYHFKDDFAKKMTDYFQAQIAEIDIFDNESAEQMNRWVREQTNDNIDSIVEPPLDDRLVAILINAIYFNGKWQYAFNEELTEYVPFYAKDREIDVPMMLLDAELEYFENKQFQAVKLPYGEGKMSMQVFLPNEDNHLEALVNTLSEEKWHTWQSDFNRMEGTVLFPKFQLDYAITLNESLNQLGITSAFEKEEANFSHMIKETDPIWIDEIKQRTFINVSEEGTEAAGVTSVTMVTESAPATPKERFYMEVNRPFFFAIIDEETKTIIFMGVMNQVEM